VALGCPRRQHCCRLGSRHQLDLHPLQFRQFGADADIGHCQLATCRRPGKAEVAALRSSKSHGQIGRQGQRIQFATVAVHSARAIHSHHQRPRWRPCCREGSGDRDRLGTVALGQNVGALANAGLHLLHQSRQFAADFPGNAGAQESVHDDVGDVETRAQHAVALVEFGRQDEQAHILNPGQIRIGRRVAWL
jgi:hypothetical protein